MPLAPWTAHPELEVSWIHYPALDVQNIVSVSGAGDWYSHLVVSRLIEQRFNITSLFSFLVWLPDLLPDYSKAGARMTVSS